MRNRVAIVLVFLLLVGCSRPAESIELKWKVVKIVDGDTIDVLDSNNKPQRIRLQGIDAPEDGQAFGTLSSRHLNDLLYGRDVVLQGDKVDRHRRMVCKVLLDGRDANLEQVNAGLAWFYRKYEGELSADDRHSYSTAENQARSAKRGLWSDATPTPPWEHRHPAAVAPAAKTSLNPPASSHGPIIGNRRSRKYHWPGCPYYEAIAPQNREYFNSRVEAETAGYRPLRIAIGEFKPDTSSNEVSSRYRFCA